MGIHIYKPTSAGRRKSSVQDFSDITKSTPVKSLIVNLKRAAGRNNTGRITVRHQGGGVKRLYRMVDFKRVRYDMPAEVKAIEYDPNRGPRVALIEYPGGIKSYILAPEGLKVGMSVMSSEKAIDPTLGARMPFRYIPVGTFVHDVELSPGKGGQIVRGAGAAAQLQTIEGEYAQIKLPSSETRLVPIVCMATVGQVGNSDYKLIRWGKAGRKRHRGWRPSVRGKAMNPVDHPHGGGEGQNSIGLRGGPKTPWGKKALGVKTRKPHRPSDQLILYRRKSKQAA